MVHRFFFAFLVLGLMAGSNIAARAEDPPVIAAASDLQFALPEVAAAFEKETGLSMRLTFGSSGNFTRQIRQLAPFQIFFSADESYVEQLARDGLTQDEGTLYARGRIVIVVPNGSALEPDGTLNDLKRALAEGRLTKFAIANPEHAPYGKRAEEALRHAGLWDDIRKRLVLGENVSQAAQFAVSGSTDGGIIAYSLALSPKIAEAARFALIPENWHAPLNQRMVLLKGAGATAKQFFSFLQGKAARAILKKYGFLLPGEGS